MNKFQKQSPFYLQITFKENWCSAFDSNISMSWRVLDHSLKIKEESRGNGGSLMQNNLVSLRVIILLCVLLLTIHYPKKIKLLLQVNDHVKFTPL